MGPWQSLAAPADQLGESPFWHSDEQMLYWLDIAARQLRRANVRVGSVQSWDMPSEPGCMAPAPCRSSMASTPSLAMTSGLEMLLVENARRVRS